MRAWNQVSSVQGLTSSELQWYSGFFAAKDKNEKKFLGFSFFFLMDADETTVKDGSHVLCVYKCEDPAKIEVRISLRFSFLGNDFSPLKLFNHSSKCILVYFREEQCYRTTFSRIYVTDVFIKNRHEQSYWSRKCVGWGEYATCQGYENMAPEPLATLGHCRL